MHWLRFLIEGAAYTIYTLYPVAFDEFGSKNEGGAVGRCGFSLGYI